MTGISFSKTEYPRGADRLKLVRGGTTQMWGGSTQDYAGRIDFGADRPVFVLIVAMVNFVGFITSSGR